MKKIKKMICVVMMLVTMLGFMAMPASAATSKSVTVKPAGKSYFTTSVTVKSGSGWNYFWGKKTQLHMKNEGKYDVIFRVYNKKGKILMTGLINPRKTVHYNLGGNGVQYNIRFSLGSHVLGRNANSPVFVWTSAGSVA